MGRVLALRFAWASGLLLAAGCGLDVVGSLVGDAALDPSQGEANGPAPPGALDGSATDVASDVAAGADGGRGVDSAVQAGTDGGAPPGPCDDPALAHAAGIWSYTALSVELWLRPAQIPTGTARAGLVDKDGSFGVFLRPNGDISCTMSASLSAPGVASVNKWVHVACTSDGTTTRLYIDGVETSSGSASSLPQQTALVAIGGNSPSGDPLAGDLDTLRVYKRARSAQEIAAAAGK